MKIPPNGLLAEKESEIEKLHADLAQLRMGLERTLSVLSAASAGISCRMAASTIYNETMALLKAEQQ